MEPSYVLLKALAELVQLPEAELMAFASAFEARTLPRLGHTLQAGEVCREVYFVEQGLLRYYLISEKGEERTGQFFVEGGWYTDYDSFLDQVPSQQYIQVLEPAQLLVLSRPALYAAYERQPRLERFGRLMAEQAYRGARARSLSMLSQTPEQRYQTLVERRPRLLQRVPLRYIASYLGIEPESLSRIRKRAAEAGR